MVVPPLLLLPLTGPVLPLLLPDGSVLPLLVPRVSPLLVTTSVALPVGDVVSTVVPGPAVVGVSVPLPVVPGVPPVVRPLVVRPELLLLLPSSAQADSARSVATRGGETQGAMHHAHVRRFEGAAQARSDPLRSAATASSGR
jgi:hypothetical protein